MGQSFVLCLWIIVKRGGGGGDGGGGLSVSLSLMKRTQRGVSPATQTMMVNMWRIKKSWDLFVVLWGNQEVEDILVPVLTLVSKRGDPGRGLTGALIQTCTLLCCVPASSPSSPSPVSPAEAAERVKINCLQFFEVTSCFKKESPLETDQTLAGGGGGGALTQT